VVTTLETDKVSVDVRSPHSGVLTELLAPVQTVVPIGAALAKLKLGAAGAAAPTPAAPAKETAPASVKVCLDLFLFFSCLCRIKN
jgi:2-oxoglutarate dehydrogenase E2 component (dihydrolipoamide succinyltransferase)